MRDLSGPLLKNAASVPELPALKKKKNRPNVIVTGAEAHVCVLRTVFGLMDLGYNLITVEDAAGSPRNLVKSPGFSNMSQCSCQIVSSETVIIEWLEQANKKIFRKPLPVMRDLAQSDPTQKH